MGSCISVRTWAEASSRLYNWLVQADSTFYKTLNDCCDKPRTTYLTKTPPQNRRTYVRIEDTDVYLITNYNAASLLAQMACGIRLSAISPSDVSIRYAVPKVTAVNTQETAEIEQDERYEELNDDDVMTVFRQLFTENGYCIGKIDEMKFASAYKDLFGESVDASAVNRTIQRLCLNVGDIYYDYDSVLDAETRGAVIDNIENRLENGASCVDAKVLLTKFDLHPLRSGDDLIAYLAHACPEYQYVGHFIGRDELESFDLNEAILEVVEEKGSCGLDDICEVLDDISPAEIQSAIKNMTEELVVDEKNKRCVPASHLYLEDDELDAVRSVIDDALEIDGTLTYGDFWDGIGEEMRERLSEFTEDGDPCTLMQLIQIMFKDAYSLTKQAIGILGQSRNINDILEQAFGYRSKVEMSEIEEVVDKNKLRNYQPTVFQYFYDHFIRINESEFIADAMLTFDCEKIDMALDGQVSNDYMLLENIDVYSLPTLGVPWNIFLLSSYLYGGVRYFV